MKKSFSDNQNNIFYIYLIQQKISHKVYLFFTLQVSHILHHFPKCSKCQKFSSTFYSHLRVGFVINFLSQARKFIEHKIISNLMLWNKFWIVRFYLLNASRWFDWNFDSLSQLGIIIIKEWFELNVYFQREKGMCHVPYSRYFWEKVGIIVEDY